MPYKKETKTEGETVVNSRTYGTHTRKPRGTHKKAELNDAFKKSGEDLKRANTDGQLLYRALNLYRSDFTGGLLWQRLLSVIRSNYAKEQGINLKHFKIFEIHRQYPLTRLFAFQTSDPRVAEGHIRVNLTSIAPPDFKRKFVKGYRIGLIAICVNFEEGKSSSSIVWTNDIPLDTPLKQHEFSVPLTEDCPDVLLCLKLQGLDVKGCPGLNPTSGMQCIWGGKIENGPILHV
jgi:hypothetical protein